MKLLITLSLALLIFSGFAFANPASSFATTNNNNYNHNDNEDEDKVTICHAITTFHRQTLIISESALRAHLAHGDTRGACPTPPVVPEFGLIPGAIALFTSGGTFLFLKKRFN